MPEPILTTPICANTEDCCRELSRVWDALVVTEYDGKSVSEHVAELMALVAQPVRDAMARTVKDFESGYKKGASDCRGIVDKMDALEAEVYRLKHEAIRAERDRARPTCATCRFIDKYDELDGCRNSAKVYGRCRNPRLTSFAGGCFVPHVEDFGCILHAPQPSAEEAQ